MTACMLRSLVIHAGPVVDRLKGLKSFIKTYVRALPAY